MTATDERIAIVTGTSAGIGEAVARRLTARQWSVIGIARRGPAFTHDAYHHIQFDLANVAQDAAGLEERIASRIREGVRRRVALVNNAAAADGLVPLARLEAANLARVYATNVVAPVWLMGLVVRAAPANAVLRIVNVSSGAGTVGFPGLAAYGSSKAALRLAGMSLAREWDAPPTSAPARRNAAILSYEPGIVETDMQRYARSQSPEDFPWVGMFHDFAARGLLVPPERPAADIVTFLEADDRPSFAEARLQV